MANHSRWDDVEKRRPGPSPETRTAIDQDLALGQLIYDLRTEAGLSQRALAERMGTTQSVISRLEERWRRPQPPRHPRPCREGGRPLPRRLLPPRRSRPDSTTPSRSPDRAASGRGTTTASAPGCGRPRRRCRPPRPGPPAWTAPRRSRRARWTTPSSTPTPGRQAGARGSTGRSSRIDAIPVGAYVLEKDGALVRCNETAIAAWGRAPELGSTENVLRRVPPPLPLG